MNHRNLSLPGVTALQEHVRTKMRPLEEPHPTYVLFFSVSDGRQRAKVETFTASDFETAWDRGLQWSQAVGGTSRAPLKWLRVDWPLQVEATTWQALEGLLEKTKRNYFRLGLALDAGFERALLEQELNANAIFYGGNKIDNAVLNLGNFAKYMKTRFPNRPEAEFQSHDPVHLFSGEGAILDHGVVHQLYPTGRDAGRRVVPTLTPGVILPMIEDGARFLAGQIAWEGRFVYGFHPCFDRTIDAYNTLRHASSTYAMIEASELFDDLHLRLSITRAIRCMVNDLIVEAILPDGTRAAFLTEANGDIKLGGNAVAILALAKHATTFDTDEYHSLMEKLALGIGFMQDPATGRFRHVIGYPGLQTRHGFRTIYYEGEASFALMRLYDLTGDARWLSMVEKAFHYFIADGYHRHHDHWLAYSVNELTRHRPREEYFRFAIDNVRNHLAFVETRVTTFPTLLELMMATRQTLRRLDKHPSLRHLKDELDLDHFDRALEARANHLLNGHFWPEYAMFMGAPDKIVGSFFIRHQAFRVRIDDVEHYLSGLVAFYLDNLYCDIDARSDLRDREPLPRPPCPPACYSAVAR